MAQGNHGFDAVFQKLIKQVVIESQPGLIGFGFIAVRENAGPGNGGPETLEPHVREHGDVFLIAAVEVNAHMVGIISAFLHAVGDHPGNAVGAGGHHVGHAVTF